MPRKAIQYLTADYQPTRVQTAQGIQRLTKNLAPFGLTKAEKLQIVNLTPVEPVELYVVCSSHPPLYSSFVHLSLADRRRAGRSSGKLHGRSTRPRAVLAHCATAIIVARH